MFDYVPDVFRGAVRGHRGGGRPLVHRPGATTSARRSCSPATRSPGRSTPRSRPGAAHRTAGCSSTSPRGCRAAEILQAAAVDVPPVQGAGRRRHHHGADGGRPDLPLRDGRRSRSTPTRPRPPACPACSPPARSPAACTARTGSAATRCRTCWCSAGAPATARPPTSRASAASTRRSATPTARRSARRHALAPFDAREGGENPYTLHAGTAAGDERPGRHHPQGRGDRGGARQARGAQGARAHGSAVEGDRQFNPGWHLALDLRNMLPSASASPGRR